jgi:hypothetical protein
MRWHNRPGILSFDAYPQESRPVGWYRFVSPPGMRRMSFAAYGKAQAWADGIPMAVTAGNIREDGSREHRAVVVRPAAGPVKVALRIEQDRGHYGGAALAEPIDLDCGPGAIAVGDWSQIDGLAAYSGGAWYRKTVILPAEQTSGQVLLDLGGVAASAEVRVNGRQAGVKVAPPWTLDISGLVRPGDNRIEILVYNTLANHYTTVPTRYGGSPVSGLLGPVRIENRLRVCLEGKTP